MKRFSGILLLTLLFAFQSMAMNTPKEIYSIQIGVFSEPQAEHFQFLTDLGMVYLENVPNSQLKKVMVSKFEDKATAVQFLEKVQNKGYSDAFIITRTIDDTKIVKTVQLASYTIGEKIDLSDAKTLGKVYLHIKQDEVRVLIGFYADITSAKIALDKARVNGFPSAFMKDTDIIWLQPATSFEENYLNLGKVKARKVANVNPNLNLNSSAKNKTNNGDPVAKASIAGLQEALKDSKKFKGNVNGIYNDDTRNSLKEFQDNNEMYQLYATRAIDEPTVITARGDVTSLQGNIELIEFNPTVAAENLQKFQHPIAKVYLAYLYFTGKVPAPSDREIDFLMNNAVNQAYANFNGRARFDYTKQYAYTNLQTIFQHYAYIAHVSDNNPKVPCWMIKEHNYELSQAFAGLTPPEFTYCEGFENIKEVRILKAMAQDMDLLSDAQRLENHSTELQAYKARRIELYLNPKKISLPEQELYEMWNMNLLDAVERNIAADPLRKDILTAFKVTYFAVYNKLENHYLMKIECEEDQAKALALATLYAFVNYNLGDYIRNDF
jgi:hypothetical protein